MWPVHDRRREVPGGPRMSFAQPCWGTVITVWPKEHVWWKLKDTAEKTRPWHPTAHIVMHPPKGASMLVICSFGVQILQ